MIDRIYGFTDEVAAAYRDIEFVKAGYLNDHPKVIATFADRVREILQGSNNMNCALCKYRAQVLGFEAEVGLAQESHHHHVEGQGVLAPGSNVEDCELCDSFCTGACRLDMDHHHDHCIIIPMIMGMITTTIPIRTPSIRMVRSRSATASRLLPPKASNRRACSRSHQGSKGHL